MVLLSVLKATCLPRPNIHHQYLLFKPFSTKTKRMVIIGKKNIAIGNSLIVCLPFAGRKIGRGRPETKITYLIRCWVESNGE